MRRCLLIAGLLAAMTCSRADDTTRAAQEALRTRELYYGDVTGTMNAETTEALRRFQEKRGLDPTGSPDEVTLRALGLAPRGGAAQPAVDERVAQCRDFIGRYLHACEAGSVDAELAFYADRVDYMSDGQETKAGLRAELAAYRDDWPERHGKLLRCVASPVAAHPDEVMVTFRYQYDVRGYGGSSRGHESKGIEDLNAILRSGAQGMRIVSIREVQ